jgi:hypothetical protein
VQNLIEGADLAHPVAFKAAAIVLAVFATERAGIVGDRGPVPGLQA